MARAVGGAGFRVHGWASSPCPLQLGCDNKTNNFLNLLSWTPFIFWQPQGRTDLVVGPACDSCTSLGAGPGQAEQARPGPGHLQDSCRLPSWPCGSVCLAAPPSPLVFLSCSGRFPNLYCFCPSLSLCPVSALLPESGHTVPSPLLVGALSPLCSTPGCAGQTRWWLSLGPSVQLLPGKRQLAGQAGGGAFLVSLERSVAPSG